MRRLLAAAVVAALAGGAAAQPASGNLRPENFAFVRTAAPDQSGAIPLYAGAAPGSPANPAAEIWDKTDTGDLIARNVSRPTLTPFLPDPAKATGAAVIVAPGGGFKVLSMDAEGWRVARWLADHGVAAFVLKYRLNESPADEAALMADMGKMLAAAASGPTGGPPPINGSDAAHDALQALKMVRARAGEWRIDPRRVGMIGFSAGAMTTLNAALAPTPSDRPDFVGFIYGPMTPIDAPAAVPPMFAALAMDDPLFGHGGFGIVDSWRKAGSKIELHVYETGGHGFGLGRPGTTTALMPDEFLAWMKGRGLLTPTATR